MSQPDQTSFRREISDLARDLRLPGLSVAVVQDGKVIYRQTEGFADIESGTPVTPDTQFAVASITKTFTAVAMMQYVQEGRIRLEDPVVAYPFASVGFLPERVTAGVLLKHVLSHTSECIPGSAFAYNGGRYNFVSGVFERNAEKSGRDSPFAGEIERRILIPLKLHHTRAGYPKERDPVIATPYLFDEARQAYVPDLGAMGHHTAYPGTGLITTIDDLATYTSALDDHRLITAESYRTMTSPFALSGGGKSPYGYGWFTGSHQGLRLHWAYGLGDSCSALLLRVPERRLSLIVLSNCAFATAMSRLGNGNVLHSPFALSFLRHFALGPAGSSPTLDNEQLFTEALTRAFEEKTFHSSAGEARKMAVRLIQMDPRRFDGSDPVLMYLLSQVGGEELDHACERFTQGYDGSRVFQPDILLAIANRYLSRGKEALALRYLHRLVDTPGFEEQSAKIEAATILARTYLKAAELKKARDYAWRALAWTHQIGANIRPSQELLDQIR
jgi:CubicO group peptidase (beta-lactamase class C family)